VAEGVVRGVTASVAAPERAAAEPFTSCWWPRAQVSRDAPPPLPGGYKVGEKVFLVAASHTFPSGNKLVHGQQGEVTGPATAETHKGKGVNVRFPGNKGDVNCYLAAVRRLGTASAASPRLHPTHATLTTPRAFPRQPLPRRPSPHCMRSRSHRSPRMDAGGMVAEGVVRGVTASVAAPERAAAEPYTSLLLTAGGCVRR
jgi:hypothetical protein